MTKQLRTIQHITGSVGYGKKELTIGIPAYNIIDIVDDLLCSIQMQTVRDSIQVVLSPDDDNDYSYLTDRFPLLDIIILPNPEKNAGPGVARDNVIEYLSSHEENKTKYVYFCDGDDVLFNAYTIEGLLLKAYKFPQSVCIQGLSVQEIDAETYRRIGGTEPRQDKSGLVANPDRFNIAAFANPHHPWTFNKMFLLDFLLKNDIRFSELRQMEDGRFSQQVKLLSDGTNKQTIYSAEVGYIWRTAVSDHSITRVGLRENDGIPLYNFDGCPFGATISFIDALYLVRKKQPLSQVISLQIAQHMVGQYTSLIECIEEKPMFAQQAWFNAKRFYRIMYRDLENAMTKEFMFQQMAQGYISLIQKNPQISPKYTFEEFMEVVRNEPFGGSKEWKDIRKNIPDWVKELDKKAGTFQEDEYTYCVPEKENGEDIYINDKLYSDLYKKGELEWQKMKV